MQLWQKLINSESVWKDVPEDGPPVEVSINAADYIAEGYTADVDSRTLAVRGIVFDGTLHAYSPAMPLVDASEYSAVAGPDAMRTYARVGRWEAPEGCPIRELTFIGFLKNPENPEGASE